MSNSSTSAMDSARATARRLSDKLLIDGVLTAALSGKSFPVEHPATGEGIASAADAGPDDVEAAVASAARAQAVWAQVPARERGKRLIAAAQHLAAHTEELAALIALESGKALRTECRVEAVNVPDVLQFFGGLASELKGESVPLRRKVLAYTVREPVGVVAAVLPWNVPLMLMAVKIAPAIVAGNAVVVKPAENCPRSAVLLAFQVYGVALVGVFYGVLQQYRHSLDKAVGITQHAKLGHRIFNSDFFGLGRLNELVHSLIGHFTQ